MLNGRRVNFQVLILPTNFHLFILYDYVLEKRLVDMESIFKKEHVASVNSRFRMKALGDE